MLWTAFCTRRTRRCYGPRFVHVVQAVQQYASMGDIFVGGAQNLVASGVWAAVRLTLTMVTQSASYLEKMSTLFMNAGRSAPRYQDMVLLYPRSKRLQHALCEYFIVILNICKHAAEFLQKSMLSQFSSAISDSSLASFEKELQQWSNRDCGRTCSTVKSNSPRGGEGEFSISADDDQIFRFQQSAAAICSETPASGCLFHI
jgi:hypothetical protein